MIWMAFSGTYLLARHEASFQRMEKIFSDDCDSIAYSQLTLGVQKRGLLPKVVWLCEPFCSNKLCKKKIKITDIVHIDDSVFIKIEPHNCKD